MPPKTQGKSSDLVRVRDNQRRSRARRHEYVAKLERKVHECSAQGLSPCTREVVPKDTILRIKEENRKLRELLAFAGVEQALVDTHLAPEASHADNRLQSSPETAQGYASASMTEASMLDGSDEMLAELFLHLPADEDGMLLEPLQSAFSFDPSSTLQNFSVPSLASPYDSSLSAPCINPLCPAESLLPISNQPDSSTTLCSVAYELVREHNKRGIDMVEIGVRLWNGFVKGEGDGGCKVENDLLSSVLQYIQG